MKKNAIIIVLILTNTLAGIFAYIQKKEVNYLRLTSEQYRVEAESQRTMAEHAMQEAMLQEKRAYEQLMIAEQQKKIAMELASRRK
jgi:hypothetical protein